MQFLDNFKQTSQDYSVGVFALTNLVCPASLPAIINTFDVEKMPGKIHLRPFGRDIKQGHIEVTLSL